MSYPHDYHTHTAFSCDSQAPMAEMCQAAIALGLPELGISDHFDQSRLDSGYDYFRLEPWAAALADCRRQLAGQITLRAGLEIGEPHLHPVEVQAILAAYPFDYVIGSLHWVHDEMTLDPPFFQRPADEAFGLYFEELEAMTRAGGFDILGHFDVVTRAGFEVYGAYDPRRYEPAIRAALKNCITHGIALELNTTSMRRAIRQVTPGPEILRWYVDMGGEHVTLGSDAHAPDRIAGHFAAAVDNLRAVGLRRVTQFEKRQARLVPLEP
jgi:histidinol-phosphatase (PHP family)